MSFVHPLFLWALTALSVPVIIHLFNFRRTRKVYFSNIRLLEQVREVSSKKRKLRDLLVLFSRVLFLLFLVLAFAQPFLPAEQGMGSGKNVIFYIDNSPSMSVPMPDRSRALDHAVSYARSVVDLFPSDTRYLVLTNDFTSGTNFRSSKEVLEQLAAIRLSSESRSYQDVQRKILSVPPADLFFISDFQQSAIGQIMVNTDTARKIGLVPVQSEQIKNVYIDSAAFENPYLVTGEKAKLTVWLRNDSRDEVEQLNVRLTSGNTLSSMTTIGIPPLGLVPVEMDVTMTDRPIPMKISIQDYPVVYDNEFYLAALPLPRLQILHFFEGKVGPYVREVFGNTNIFQFQSEALQNMSYDRLDKADLIILEGVNKGTPGLQRHLKDHPEQRLLVIPSDDPDPNFIASLIGIKLELLKNPGRLPLAVPSPKDPFFENVMEDRSSDLRMPEVTPSIRWVSDRSALLQFRDGSPMLSRFGRFFLLASSLTPSKNELGMHALFVPVMYRLAASARTSMLRPYHYLHENPIVLPLDSINTETPARLIGPSEVVPAQRVADGKLIMELPGSLLGPGHYAVARKLDSLGILALNYGRSESRMEFQSTQDLIKTARQTKNIHVFEGGSVQAFSKGIKERYLGVPLWKYCLILSLVFLFTEVLLIRLFNSSASSRSNVQAST